MRTKRVIVNIDVIQERLAHGTILSFSFFLKSKMILGNSCIYKANRSLREIAKRFNCSHSAVQKYLEQLKAQELTYEHSGNLCFKSKKQLGKLKKQNQIHIYLSREMSVREVSDCLKFAVLKKNAEQQKFMAKLKTDCSSEKLRIDIKHYKKYIRSRPSVMSKPNRDLVISNENLANKLNTTSQSISYLKKKWLKMGLCQFYRQFKKVGRTTGKSSWYNGHKATPGIFCSDRGVLYKSLPSKFILVGKESLRDFRNSKRGL